jgi:hypothetical protein
MSRLLRLVSAAAGVPQTADPLRLALAVAESGHNRPLKAFRFQQFQVYSFLIALSSLVCLG